MTRTVFRPELPVPSVSRVLWRAGSPPSRAGEKIESGAREALELLTLEMKPAAQAITGLILPVQLEEAFGKHLRGTVSWTVFMATLGRSVDDRIARLQEDGSHLAAHMLNAAAGEAVEQLAASIHIRMVADLSGATSTARFAPGYGDIPLEAQRDVTGLFPGMDVECTESFYLVPSKTVTGVWGWVRRRD